MTNSYIKFYVILILIKNVVMHFSCLVCCAHFTIALYLLRSFIALSILR